MTRTLEEAAAEQEGVVEITPEIDRALHDAHLASVEMVAMPVPVAALSNPIPLLAEVKAALQLADYLLAEDGIDDGRGEIRAPNRTNA